MSLLVSALYREAAAPPAVRVDVQCLWWHYQISDGTPHVTMPDVTTDLVYTADVVAGSPFTGDLRLSGGTLTWVGPATRARTVRRVGGSLAVGVRFAPWAAAGYAACAAAELADAGAPAATLTSNAAGRELESALREARSVNGLLECLAAALSSWRRRVHAGVPLLRRAWPLLTAADADAGPPRIAAVAVRLGVNERRLHRAFVQHVGLPPQSVHGILRFHGLLRALAVPAGGKPSSWADLAQRCGYYDQAHMINEVRRLTAVTPTQLVR